VLFASQKPSVLQNSVPAQPPQFTVLPQESYLGPQALGVHGSSGTQQVWSPSHFPELHWLPTVHCTHWWLDRSQPGVGTLQSAALTQATQVPVEVSQAGVGAPQSADEAH
jgi:hypothetical protein